MNLSHLTIIVFSIALSAHILRLIYRGRSWGILTTLFFSLGFILNSALVIIRWVESGRPPFSNTYETMLFLSWGLALSYLISQSLSPSIRRLGALFSLLTVIILSLTERLFDKSILPLIPALQSRWLTVHVISCILGYALFAGSFIIALTHLIKRDIVWERITYRFVTVGFFFLTVGVITGSIWAQAAWGRWWGWDPKESWALITWLIYVIYLHARTLKGWAGLKTSWIAVIGFLMVIFTYLGGNYLLRGLHSYM